MSDYGLMADFGLLIWIPITAIAFWRLTPPRAALVVVLGMAMFAPQLAFFKLPAFPPLDKNSIPYLLILLACLARIPRTTLAAKPGRRLEWLALFMALGAVGTYLTNQDELTYGSWITVYLPGLTLNDGLYMAVRTVITFGLPFFLGRLLFRRIEDLHDLLRFLAIAGLIYSIFIWVEVRMSPQFHNWVYGFGAHSDWLQTIRWGGYRPMVFMAHGLAVGLFMLNTLLASTALARGRMWTWKRVSPKWIAIYLVLVVLACKSTGTIIYAAALVPLLIYVRPERQVRLMAVLALVVLLYPALRMSELFPDELLVDAAESISVERADSLNFRFDNEARLLEKAMERPVFGWGEYGRNSLFDEEIGTETAVADGHWIILLGVHGSIGVICGLGLLLFPILALYWRFRQIRRADQGWLASLAVIVGVCSLDLIPNGLFSTYPYFLSGALYGVTRGLVAAHARELRRRREARRLRGLEQRSRRSHREPERNDEWPPAPT